MQVEFRNKVAGTNRSRFEVLPSGAAVLSRGDRGFFAMAPLGVMDELLDTGTAIYLSSANTVVRQQ